MKRKSTLLAGLLCAVIAAPAVQAQDANGAIKARKAAMQLYSHYMGKVGAMAKGATDYDAEAAQTAANNLQAAANLDQSAMWPQGSDNGAMGDKTRALPAIWTTFPAISERGEEFSAAVATLVADAGKGLPALQAAVGQVGAACGACHKAYRAPRN